MTTSCPKTLAIDIETYSTQDLKKTGVYRYAEDPEFRILLFAFSYDGKPVEVLDLTKQELPEQIIQDILNPAVLKEAHNASFERVCLSAYLKRRGKLDKPYLDPEGWYCTMVHSSMCGLPASLAQVGKALGLASEERKLDSGTLLIRFFCMPNKKTGRNLPKDYPEKWAQFIEYNRRDVETELAIERALVQIYPFPTQELQRYWTDQRINDLGVQTDRQLIAGILECSKEHTEQLRAEALELAGLNVGSPTQILAWMQAHGRKLANTRKETIVDAIKQEKDPTIRRLLEIRLEVGKTSLKKYDVFKNATCKDGRIRGIIQFYGSRTGRYAGRLLQPQNLPRNAFEDVDEARKLVAERDWETIDLVYPSLNDVFSTLIRTAIIPAPGRLFAVADYSAIEARVIAWLADEKWRREAFHEGKDIYCQSASAMFGVPVEKHGQNADLRKKGKVAELACGYQGHIGALKAFGADKMGLTETDMADIIAKWRAASPRICALWKTLENLARKALDGKEAKTRGLVFRKGSSPSGRAWLEIELPSGRKLIYQNPRYENVNGRNQLCFDGQNQTTKKWETIPTYGGKLTENVVQAIARDCLATAIDRLTEQNFWPVMHIHDEVVVEIPRDELPEANLKRVEDIMGAPIDWAPGLELTADGFVSAYYRKD